MTTDSGKSGTPKMSALARKWSLTKGGTNVGGLSPEMAEVYDTGFDLETELTAARAEVLRLQGEVAKGE